MKKVRTLQPRKAWESLARWEESRSREVRGRLEDQVTRLRQLETQGRAIQGRVEDVARGALTTAEDLQEQLRLSEKRMLEWEAIQQRLRQIRDQAASLEERATAHAAQSLMFRRLRER